MFEREDWTLFRNLGTLGQKAGISTRLIPRLVAKELADNALDATGGCRVGILEVVNGLWIEDDGDGIPGTDEEIAGLFSINRPLVSSKVLRRPSRGALGNGLRVVAGAVLASGGSLIVATGGRLLRIEPQEKTGESLAARLPGEPGRRGTRVEVVFGPTLRVGSPTLDWAHKAILLAEGGPTYKGETSPYWYDADSFFEVCQAAGDRTAQGLIARFDGCSEPKAGRIADGFKGRLARDLNRAESSALLEKARASAKAVNARRLGRVGPIAGMPAGYAKDECELRVSSGRGVLEAVLPIVVEVWSGPASRASAHLYVNRTPAPVELEAHHSKSDLNLFGCGLSHGFAVGKKPVTAHINIVTPFMPITSDGKAPDLSTLVDVIGNCVEASSRRARKLKQGVAKEDTQKAIIVRNLPDSIAKAGGGGQYRFSIRQLFYAVRPFVLEALQHELKYGYFSDVVTEYENERGEIAGMYRDARGTIYHPHLVEEIALGTLNVEGYRRPEWAFNKILYCEKEGFFPLLRAARWPERHDCALLTSKGYASRAARDVLDLLGETGEDLWFYCIHDADADGTMIFQSLLKETRARPGRKVHIVNLGLEPEEALAMGLQVEKVQREGGKIAPVADYLKGTQWETWLQTHRVELNAMTTPQFLEWLDRKFVSQAGKVVPPNEVLVERLRADAAQEIERQITARILGQADIAGQVEREMARRGPLLRDRAETIRAYVETVLLEGPDDWWVEPVKAMAVRIAKGDAAPLPLTPESSP
jgi:hypothetical protein